MSRVRPKSTPLFVMAAYFIEQARQRIENIRASHPHLLQRLVVNRRPGKPVLIFGLCVFFFSFAGSALAAPHINSLSPTSGAIGASVTIAGTNFGSTKGSSTVKFNGTTATTTSWSATSIVAAVPTGATTGNVVVTVSGSASNGVSFTVVSAPSITSLSITTGAVGAAVTITGTNFGSTQGSSSVKFNGTTATVTSWSATSIATTVPSGATTGNVVVFASGVNSNGSSFTVVSAPSITSLSITTGAVGAAVTIAGTNFGSTQGSSTVKFNGTAAAVTSWSATSIATTVPTGGTTGNVVVFASGVNSNGSSFTVASAPSITSLSITTGAVGAAVTITGTNFGSTQGSGIVSFNGTAATVISWGATSIATTVPTGATIGNVVVFASGVNSNGSSFTVSAPIMYVYDQLGRLVGVSDPSGNTVAYSYDAVGNLLSIGRFTSTQISLSNFSPSKGPAGATVTIFGSGYSTTISQDTVTFNGATATVTSASVNSLVVTVPTGASTGQIQVTSPAGTATSSTSFTVTADNGAPTITSITPTVATHGTSITVTGTNISTTLGNDEVSFNITPQVVSSATSTSLSATIPAQTSSGRITLSTPGGTAVSSQDLYIPFGTHVASDVGVAERTTIGTPATVSISTAGQIGLVIFDGSAGQKVDMWRSSSTFGYCDLYLFAPDGSTLYHNFDAQCWNSSDAGPFPVTLPATGTYTAGVDSDGTATGSITITPQDTPDVTGTITPGGSAVTVTTTVPGQDARLTFTGTIGQQVYLKISNITTSDAFVYLVRPDGRFQGQSFGIYGTDQSNTSVEIGPTSGSQFYYLDTTILEMTGTYTIWVQHAYYYVGSEQLYLGNAPTPVTGTIAVDGSPVTVTTTTAWQSAELTFSGTAGQVVFIKITNISIANGYLNLIAPDGTVINWLGFESGSGYWFAGIPVPLPMSGTYTWWVQNDGADTGSETMELFSVPSSSGTISPGGSAVTVTTTTPGQQEILTFSGTAGQRVFVTITSISTPDAFVYLMRTDDPSTPVNSFLAWTEINSGAGYWYYLSPDPLPYTGTYRIFVQHVGSYTGSETLQMYDVTTNVTGTITAGGTSVTATTTLPGQDAKITFSGTTGDRNYLLLTGVTLEDAYVNLIAPDGTNLAWGWTGSSYSSYYQFNARTLPQTGTYTWFIQNYSPTTGSETLQMYAPPADVTGTITVGGTSVNVATTAVGQGAKLTFSGTASQSVTLTVTSVSNGGTWINLIDPSGNYVDWIWVYGTGSSTFTMGPDTLPSTGTYTLWIQAVGTNYGSETLQLN